MDFQTERSPKAGAIARRTMFLHRLSALLCIALALAVTLAVVASPLVLRLPLMDGEFLVAWRSATIRRLWIPIAIALAGLAVGGWMLVRHLGRGVPKEAWRIVEILAPLLLAPACAAWSLLSPWIGATLAGLAVPFGLPALAAWTLERWCGPLVDATGDRPSRSGLRWLLGAYTAFLLGFGLYFNGQVGEDIGDEAHYLTQLTSLITDGDLSVGNNLPKPLPPSGPARVQALAFSHLRDAGDGRCYSYHAFGLPILAWPFGYAGFFGRQLILALIGALSLAGCWAVCIATGVPRRAALVVTASLGLSLPWVVYAVRFLPEVLGCGMLAWAFWGFIMQADRPWRSLVVTVLCCGLLPYAHTRYAGPSLVIAFCYGLRGLFLREPVRRKVARLAVLCAVYGACGILLLSAHAAMFGSGGAYAYGNILFSYPLSLWGIIADDRGLLSVLPVLMWYLAAGCLAFGMDKDRRMVHGVALTTLAAVLVTTCSNEAALGGACVPGRYLFTAVPVLLPAAAALLARSGRSGRTWFHFLSMLSITLLAATAVVVRKPGGPFVLPVHRLARVLGFHALFQPLAAVRLDTWVDVACSAAFVLALLAVTLAVIARPRRKLVVVATVLGVLVGLYGGYRVHRLGQSPRIATHVLLGASTDRMTYQRIPVDAPERDLFEALGTWQSLGVRPPQMLTNRDLGRSMVDGMISLPRLAVNDWRGRPYRWHAMHSPIRSNRDGGVAVRVVGIVHGDVRAAFAMRQGAYTVEDGEIMVTDGPFQRTWVIPTRRGRGDVMPLVRLEGPEGVVRIKRVLVAPSSPALLEGARLVVGAPDAVRRPSGDARHEP